MVLGGYAIKDGGTIYLFGKETSVAGIVVFSAIFPLFAFYFMDRCWYHRLLDGAVNAGIEAETAIQDLGYKVDLGFQIKKISPFTLWFTSGEIHSKTKMDFFYGMLFAGLLIVSGILAFAIKHPEAPPAPNQKASDTSKTLAPASVPAPAK